MFYKQRENRNINPLTRIVIRLLTIIYLIFLTMSQLSSPTGATFTSTSKVQGSLTADQTVQVDDGEKIKQDKETTDNDNQDQNEPTKKSNSGQKKSDTEAKNDAVVDKEQTENEKTAEEQQSQPKPNSNEQQEEIEDQEVNDDQNETDDEDSESDGSVKPSEQRTAEEDEANR